MSQQLRTDELQYEGFPLEAVLERVFAERGPDASITGADRVRKGGIGGFFAKEVFRVTVAVDRPSEAAVPRSFASLGRIGVEPDDDVAIDPDDIDPEDIDGALALDVGDERTAEEREIWAMLAEVSKPSVANPLFGRGRLESVNARVNEPEPEPVLESASPTDDALAWSTQFWMVDPEDDTESARPEPYQFPVEIAQDVLAEALMSVVSDSPTDPTATSAPEIVAPIVSGGPIASTVLIAPSQRSTVDPRGSVVALRSRRVRRAFSSQIHLDELIAEFEDSASAVPEIPQQGIVAIVGCRNEAIEVAEMLARQLEIDPDEVLLAAPQSPIEIPSHVDATRLAATARYRCTPLAIVVIELVPGRLGHEWARTVLAGLRAEHVRFATAADRVVAQQRLTIAAVGGVDAIDLVDATSCAHPEAMLDLGVPVATIDGRAATPEMWAATVLASNQRAAGTVDRSAAANR